MGVVNVSGRLSLLRVHDRGTKFGPPNDQVDVEVIVAFANRPNEFFGFQLRQDANAPVREGMLGLLRDGFNHNWVVNLDFDQQPNRRNSVLFRVWLTKPPNPGPGGGGIGGGGVVVDRTTQRSRARSAKAAKAAKPRAPAKKVRALKGRTR
jgi:hypothetical protein